jgi:hypothetical protein
MAKGVVQETIDVGRKMVKEGEVKVWNMSQKNAASEKIEYVPWHLYIATALCNRRTPGSSLSSISGIYWDLISNLWFLLKLLCREYQVFIKLLTLCLAKVFRHIRLGLPQRRTLIVLQVNRQWRTALSETQFSQWQWSRNFRHSRELYRRSTCPMWCCDTVRNKWVMFAIWFPLV